LYLSNIVIAAASSDAIFANLLTLIEESHVEFLSIKTCSRKSPDHAPFQIKGFVDMPRGEWRPWVR
jgi:hypothetical protein